MDNQHRNEWYGPEATMFKKCDGYNLINYQCEGTGTCLDYSLFPGIDLIFMDFNCSDTFREPWALSYTIILTRKECIPHVKRKH